MSTFRKLLEILAIAVNLALGMACCALGLLGWIARGDMYLPLIPAAPERVASVLVALGAFGILSACLAMRGGRWNSFPMLLWSVGLVSLIGSTIFRSGFRFDGMTDFTMYGWIFLGALGLLCAAWLRFRARPSGAMQSPHHRRWRKRRSRFD